MEENKDYLSLVIQNIEKDKLLRNTNPKYHTKIKKLLEKRDLLRKNNGLFAEIKINSINRKLNKIKNKK